MSRGVGIRLNPVGQRFLVNFASRDGADHDHCLCFIGIELHAVAHQEYVDRVQRDPLVTVRKALIAGKTESVRGRQLVDECAPGYLGQPVPHRYWRGQFLLVARLHQYWTVV